MTRRTRSPYEGASGRAMSGAGWSDGTNAIATSAGAGGMKTDGGDDGAKLASFETVSRCDVR